MSVQGGTVVEVRSTGWRWGRSRDAREVETDRVRLADDELFRAVGGDDLRDLGGGGRGGAAVLPSWP